MNLLMLLSIAEWCAFLLTAAVIAWTDHRTRRIPNKLLLILLLFRLVFLTAWYFADRDRFWTEVLVSLCGFLLGATQCGIFVPMFRDRIGAGDHKMLWTVATCCGVEAYVRCLLGMLILLLVCEWRRRRENRTELVPLAPYVFFGMIAAALTAAL